MTEDVASTPIGMLIGGDLVTVDPDTTLQAVAELLAEAGVGAVVVGQRTDVLGVLSERDLVGAMARGDDPDAVRAGEVATKELVWCRTGSTVADVAREMLDHWVRHVLVASDDGLEGIVSARDLLGAYASTEMELP